LEHFYSSTPILVSSRRPLQKLRQNPSPSYFEIIVLKPVSAGYARSCNIRGLNRCKSTFLVCNLLFYTLLFVLVVNKYWWCFLLPKVFHITYQILVFVEICLTLLPEIILSLVTLTVYSYHNQITTRSTIIQFQIHNMGLWWSLVPQETHSTLIS